MEGQPKAREMELFAAFNSSKKKYIYIYIYIYVSKEAYSKGSCPCWGPRMDAERECDKCWLRAQGLGHLADIATAPKARLL